ncbi:hypothetical protein GCM10010964_18550 [Caldovatus sediminis]|uniref:Uncharacterized protein n=1 Tax=Caldovatus sediminis TaxID=2041189 RepID=A0A8J2ZBB0_9PROT|nr:hypothetical protein [Caldovatus sediminis]GGG30907.1 hypothetical protein GCM10010964_18550 [Caldovatus sediminis]
MTDRFERGARQLLRALYRGPGRRGGRHRLAELAARRMRLALRAAARSGRGPAAAAEG